ncbi:MAG: DUF5676 family membrane protein [Leucothrix sp.]
MKLNTLKIGYAAAAVFALVWLICSTLVWILPSIMLTMSGHMVHSDLSGMEWNMSPIGFMVGLLAWSLIAGGIASLIAYIYNKQV